MVSSAEADGLASDLDLDKDVVRHIFANLKDQIPVIRGHLGQRHWVMFVMGQHTCKIIGRTIHADEPALCRMFNRATMTGPAKTYQLRQ